MSCYYSYTVDYWLVGENRHLQPQLSCGRFIFSNFGQLG